MQCFASTEVSLTTGTAIGNPIKIITLYRNAQLHSDLSGSAYQRQFARVDTKEGSKSGDFMGWYPTGRFAKIVNQEDCTGGV